MAEVRAEMVANVFKVLVSEGDQVDVGDTLVILEEKRMDDEQPGEDLKTAGQFILYLDLRRLNSEPQLVFDPSIQIGK